MNRHRASIGRIGLLHRAAPSQQRWIKTLDIGHGGVLAGTQGGPPRGQGEAPAPTAPRHTFATLSPRRRHTSAIIPPYARPMLRVLDARVMPDAIITTGGGERIHGYTK